MSRRATVFEHEVGQLFLEAWQMRPDCIAVDDPTEGFKRRHSVLGLIIPVNGFLSSNIFFNSLISAGVRDKVQVLELEP